MDQDQVSNRHESGVELGIQYWSSVPVQTCLHNGMQTPEIEGWTSRGYRSRQPAPAIGLEGGPGRRTS